MNRSRASRTDAPIQFGPDLLPDDSPSFASDDASRVAIRRFILSQQGQPIDPGLELAFIMAFQIKRKGPGTADLLTEDKYEDAIHTAHRLIRERVAKTRTTVTNLKTGETLGQDDIEEAALSVGAPKRRSANG